MPENMTCLVENMTCLFENMTCLLETMTCVLTMSVRVVQEGTVVSTQTSLLTVSHFSWDTVVVIVLDLNTIIIKNK